VVDVWRNSPLFRVWNGILLLQNSIDRPTITDKGLAAAAVVNDMAASVAGLEADTAGATIDMSVGVVGIVSRGSIQVHCDTVS